MDTLVKGEYSQKVPRVSVRRAGGFVQTRHSEKGPSQSYAERLLAISAQVSKNARGFTPTTEKGRFDFKDRNDQLRLGEVALRVRHWGFS
jgi:hypothetical protein